MVIRDTSGQVERAQLILLGSIALAFVLVGLVVVINTVLFTDTVTSPGGTVDSPNEAAEFEGFSRTSTQSLVFRLNHGARNFSRKQLTGYVGENLTNLEQLIQESYAVNRPVETEIVFNPGPSSNGSRIVQARDTSFNSSSYAGSYADEPDWTPVNRSQAADVGRFVVNLNMTGTSTEGFNITLINESQDYLNISLRRVDDAGAPELRIDTNRTYGSMVNTTDERCEVASRRVLLELTDGESFSGDCSFRGLENFEPPYSVKITDGGNANGKYGIVLNETVESFSERTGHGPSGSGTFEPYEQCGSGTSLRDPCRAPVVWTANITTQYESQFIQSTREYNVSIYP